MSRFAELALTSTQVAAAPGRKVKVELLAACLRTLAVDERAFGARCLAGVVAYKLGVGYAALVELQSVPAAAEATLAITEVDRRLAAIAELRGSGAGRGRKAALGALLAAATAGEQQFLGALLAGGLRQGAEAALVLEAIAKLAEVPLDGVRTAHMLSGDIGVVAEAVLADGAAGVARFGLTVFRPILPMLAQTAADTGAALASLAGPAAFEVKLDGFRVQIHKADGVVRVFSRGLNDVTARVPEVVAAVHALPARRLILDGEAIAIGDAGRPLPFQDTMRRFGRNDGDGPPLTLSLFDALLVDDQTLLAEPTRTRLAVLNQLAPALDVPRLVTGDAAAAAAFYDDAIARGHEGVMAKALEAPYDAGIRGAAWLKIKRVRRLDLVVLAAEWGSGRRRGWLSNLWLGARDGTGWVMLGKTFKGLTDEVLAWQTAQFLAREVDRDGHVVYVRPELVVEIAFNDIQRSSTYPGGFALRFARVVRYRDDKSAAEADTIDAVRALAIADGVVAE